MFNFNYPMEDEYYDAPVPRITIPMFDDLPIPELPLDEESLERMVEIPCLVNYMDGSRSPDRARFWLAYDTKGLVIAGKLYAPEHGRDDVVESQLEHEQLRIIINPTPSKTRGYRIRLRPDRVMSMDARGEDAPESWWGEEGKLEQRIEEDGWSFTVKIPFVLMGVECPEKGQKWGMNLFRYLFKRQEDNASWSIMYLGRTDIPERYGEVVFGGKGVCGGYSGSDVLPGNSQATFKILNTGGCAETLVLEAVYQDRSLEVKRFIVNPGKHEVRMDFILPDGGNVLLLAKTSEGKLIATWHLNTGLQVLGPRVEAVRNQVTRVDRSSPKVRSEAERIQGAVANLENGITAMDGHATTWLRLEDELLGLEREASILIQRARLPDPGVPAVALAMHSLTKILPDLPIPEILSQELELKAPGRGSDSGQVMVFALDDDLSDCEVVATSLRGPGQFELKPENFEIWRVGNVIARRPRYIVEHVGRHPDPLLPLEPFNVQEGGCEVLWITVSVPPGTPAGTYKGRIETHPSNSPALEIPVSLKVWGFELPVRSTLKTAFPMFETEIEKFYGKPVSREQRWLYYDFLLRRRISPSCQYEEEPRPRIEDLDRVMDRGSNVISTGYLEYEELDKWIENVRPMMEFLSKRGWPKWSYVYGFDEVGPQGYSKLVEAYGKVKESYPDAPRACTIGPDHDLPKIFGTVDIWIPQTDRFEEIYKERQAAGDELWWYVSMWPRHPFANMFVDYPAIDHRILFWQTWKYGVTGFLYYCINLWSSNCVGQPSMEREVAGLPDARDREAIDKGARWPEVPWNTYTGPTATNGDGQMIYPGPDGGPLSSVRLECVRHGIEDYDILAMLRGEVDRLSSGPSADAAGLIKEAESLLEIPPEVGEDLTHFTHDPLVLLKTRERVGNLIERMASL